jgi:hypothetical protein
MTLTNFRHLFEQNNLHAALFAKAGELLIANGTTLSGSTIVDATFVIAPGLTKKADNTCDPESQIQQRGYDKGSANYGTWWKTPLLHLEQWRGIATRCENKCTSSFLAVVHIRCIALWAAIS